jgi:gamma-glutamyl-gamma-aminobutyrate hydrolase PuuD
MKVFIVGYGPQYMSMFVNRGWDLVADVEDADLVQFTGGEDVHPHCYDEMVHPETGPNMARDYEEAQVFDLCKYLKIPMAGICRGGQFLNVMNGGKLYQHVDGHATGNNHSMITYPSQHVINVTSTHHQMMIPAKHGDVMAYAFKSTFRETCPKGRILINKEEEHEDTEVILYKDTKTLCFQPHPEFGNAPVECTDYYFELIEEIIDGYDN